jgi:hypothetical protein
MTQDELAAIKEQEQWRDKAMFVKQLEAVEFAEWLRTFDSLEKKHGFWLIESQISSEELYKLFLKDRERWRNDF